MKQIFFAFLLIAGISGIAVGQSAKGPVNSLKINSVPFLTNKKAIVKIFGNPSKVFAPHYECGFFADEQGVTYYALQYQAVKWIGNQKKGYQLDHIFLSSNSNLLITCKGKKLSVRTTPEEFMQLTGVHNATVNVDGENPDDLIRFIGDRKLKTTSIDLTSPGSDDKYIFYFYKNKLCKIEYWSPC